MPLPMIMSPGRWPAAQAPTQVAAIFMWVAAPAATPGSGRPPARVEVISTV